ncbi:unnamed protein product [Caenorhabditis bovis]|uniref:Exonuclease 1 n=1 Tax=Caenorhabditis bovis TaxID=2654633 RepID=A0A8S1FGF6_9PELO|nr:unnamed protein product [Caenorhabditis bovis]
MGISGLLPFVKNACRAGNIIELKGKSVAVDVSCLLHRGLTGCMDKIHMGKDTTSYVYYVEKYIKELLSYDCHIVMVFDGRPLPSKKQTIFFRKWRNVDIVVAPYEVMKAELVDAVITEDSDLIVFGCETIYFKWQSGSGECTVYEKKNLPKCFTGELGGDKFDFVKFRRICIISGCDYLQSERGAGSEVITDCSKKDKIISNVVKHQKIPVTHTYYEKFRINCAIKTKNCQSKSIFRHKHWDSPLSVIETENTVTINTFRFVGCKGAGLSRKKF